MRKEKKRGETKDSKCGKFNCVKAGKVVVLGREELQQGIYLNTH